MELLERKTPHPESTEAAESGLSPGDGLEAALFLTSQGTEFIILGHFRSIVSPRPRRRKLVLQALFP